MSAPAMTVPKSQTADGFLAAVARQNPFSHHRVTAAGSQPADVASIHDAEFRKLTALARRAGEQNEAVGALVWGEAGAGKSNLLRRLGEWAGHGRAVVVPFLDLYAAPDRLHRAVLNAVVSRLTNGFAAPWHDTPLYGLLNDMVMAAGMPFKTMADVHGHYNRLAVGLVAEAGGGPAAVTATTALYRFLRTALAVKTRRADPARPEAAARWLGGDALDAAEATAVGLRPADVAATPDPAQCAAVLAVLAQLLRANGKPLILCFDQVHTLPPAQIESVLRLLHDLNDRLRNTLLVLSEVRAEFEKYGTNGMVTQATLDRLTANTVTMPRLSVAQARTILEARLVPFLQPFEGTPGVTPRLKQDTLFPLGSAWFADRFRDTVDLRPRRAIDAARRRWDELQESLAAAKDPAAWLAAWPPLDGPNPPPPPPDPESEEKLIDACVAEALDARLAKTLADQASLPPNKDNLRGLTEALLAGAGLAVETQAENATYDLLVRRPAVAGVTFITAGSTISVAGALRRMIEDGARPARVVLVTDARKKLAYGKSGEAKGRLYYNELRGVAGFEHVDLLFPDYASLEALDAVARQAADLEIDTPAGKRRLTKAEVFAAYRRQNRLVSHPLLGRFLGAESPPPPATEPEPPPAPVPDMLWVGAAGGQPAEIPVDALKTHVAVVGAAGSGKTWLAKVVAEEAILAGVAVLAVDPQGDLVQFLRPADPAGLSPAERERSARFRQSAAVRILTPGTDHATRVSLNPLKLPAPGVGADQSADVDDLLATAASHLVTLAKASGEVESQKTFVLQLLRTLTAGPPRDLTLGDIAAALRDPAAFGLDDPDQFVKKSERERLARQITTLEHGPSAKLFTGGRPLDVGWLAAAPAPGKTPLNVVYLNALADDAEKQAFVAALAVEVYRWMVTSGSSGGRPRLLFYLDEARDYLPAGNAQPPAKGPLLRLFAQGRKYGVACLVCTQSPRSVDHNVFGNCSTKLIGRLESAQDADRVKEWFAQSGAAPSWIAGRNGADKGTFAGRWPDGPGGAEGVSFTSRQLLSAHEGAWSPERVAEEVKGDLGNGSSPVE